MAAINITKKVVNILVNGNQEASYDQRQNSRDYDVSISRDTSFQWSSNAYTTLYGEDSYTYPVTTEQFYEIDITNMGYAIDLSISIGGTVVYSRNDTDSGINPTLVYRIESGDDIVVDGWDSISPNDWNVRISEANNISQHSMDGYTVLVPDFSSSVNRS